MINPEELNMKLIFSDFVIHVENNLTLSEREELIDYINDDSRKTQLVTEIGQTAGVLELGEEYRGFPQSMKILVRRVEEAFDETHKMLELSDDYVQKIDNYWINYSCNREISYPHNHPQNCLVAVYYPKTHKKSYLSILDMPRASINSIPDDARGEVNQITMRQYKVFAEEDSLCVFPAWLWHFVQQGDVDGEERLSIAFNSSIVKK
jgi:hypothetical protein